MAAAPGPANQITVNVDGYSIDYRVSARIGRGGFGRVYKATRSSDGQVVAAKELDLEMNNSNIAREMMNSYNLPRNHENIIHVEDVRVDHCERKWIFMELCPFGDLTRYFFDCPDHVAPIETKLVIMKQLMDGLTFLHECDIIHRDIKPQNILIKSHPSIDNEGAVKITDFGLSKFIENDASTSAMTTSVGTHDFKAPEFFDRQGSEPLKYHRSVDIFSSGLTCMAMVQHVPGEPLVPRIDQSGGRVSTFSVAIEMVSRRRHNQPEVQFFTPSPDDDLKTKAVKRLIPDMLKYDPHERKVAEHVHRELLQILHAQGESALPGNALSDAQLCAMALECERSREAEFPNDSGPNTWMEAEVIYDQNSQNMPVDHDGFGPVPALVDDDTGSDEDVGGGTTTRRPDAVARYRLLRIKTFRRRSTFVGQLPPASQQLNIASHKKLNVLQNSIVQIVGSFSNTSGTSPIKEHVKEFRLDGGYIKAYTWPLVKTRAVNIASTFTQFVVNGKTYNSLATYEPVSSMLYLVDQNSCEALPDPVILLDKEVIAGCQFNSESYAYAFKSHQNPNTEGLVNLGFIHCSSNPLQGVLHYERGYSTHLDNVYDMCGVTTNLEPMVIMCGARRNQALVKAFNSIGHLLWQTVPELHIPLLAPIYPKSVCADNKGNIFVADHGPNSAVLLYAINGKYMGKALSKEEHQLGEEMLVAWDERTSKLVVSHTVGQNDVKRIGVDDPPRNYDRFAAISVYTVEYEEYSSELL